jgi:hypothetical protein
MSAVSFASSLDEKRAPFLSIYAILLTRISKARELKSPLVTDLGAMLAAARRDTTALPYATTSQAESRCAAFHTSISHFCRCEHCFKPLSNPAESTDARSAFEDALLCCTRCSYTRYCSSSCKVADSTRHSAICQHFRKLFEMWEVSELATTANPDVNVGLLPADDARSLNASRSTVDTLIRQHAARSQAFWRYVQRDVDPEAVEADATGGIPGSSPQAPESTADITSVETCIVPSQQPPDEYQVRAALVALGIELSDLAPSSSAANALSIDAPAFLQQLRTAGASEEQAASEVAKYLSRAAPPRLKEGRRSSIASQASSIGSFSAQPGPVGMMRGSGGRRRSIMGSNQCGLFPNGFVASDGSELIPPPATRAPAEISPLQASRVTNVLLASGQAVSSLIKWVNELQRDVDSLSQHAVELRAQHKEEVNRWREQLHLAQMGSKGPVSKSALEATARAERAKQALAASEELQASAAAAQVEDLTNALAEQRKETLRAQGAIEEVQSQLQTKIQELGQLRQQLDSANQLTQRLAAAVEAAQEQTQASDVAAAAASAAAQSDSAAPAASGTSISQGGAKPSALARRVAELQDSLTDERAKSAALRATITSLQRALAGPVPRPVRALLSPVKVSMSTASPATSRPTLPQDSRRARIAAALLADDPVVRSTAALRSLVLEERAARARRVHDAWRVLGAVLLRQAAAARLNDTEEAKGAPIVLPFSLTHVGRASYRLFSREDLNALRNPQSGIISTAVARLELHAAAELRRWRTRRVVDTALSDRALHRIVSCARHPLMTTQFSAVSAGAGFDMGGVSTSLSFSDPAGTASLRLTEEQELRLNDVSGGLSVNLGSLSPAERTTLLRVVVEAVLFEPVGSVDATSADFVGPRMP